MALKKKVTKKATKKKAAKKATKSFKTGPESAPKVKVGKAVPAFKLPVTGEGEITHSDLSSQKTVLFFYKLFCSDVFS